MGLLLRCLSIGGEHASLVLALHSGQWPETLMMRLSCMSRWSISVHDNWDGIEYSPHSAISENAFFEYYLSQLSSCCSRLIDESSGIALLIGLPSSN